MKLIYAKGACSLSVHILLEELQQPYEAIRVSLQDKKVLESYNSKSYVPALVLENGEVLTEATAILQYLSVEHNGAFMPTHPFERARCIEWLTFVSTELHKGLGPLFHKDSLNEKFLQETREKVNQRLGYLEERLQGQPFIMRFGYTIADMYALAILRIAEHVDVSLEAFPSLVRYKKELELRPVIRKVIEIEEQAKLETQTRDSSEAGFRRLDIIDPGTEARM